MTHIQTKRVYSDPEGTAEDGYRVYIDRLWPRGESKVKFHYDLWDKDIAPSTELREWFHTDTDNRWEEFRRRYTEELDNNPAVKNLIATIRGHKTVTLLYSSHDTARNNAIVLADYLSRKL